VTNDLSIENMGVKYNRYPICIYILFISTTNNLRTHCRVARLLTTNGEPMRTITTQNMTTFIGLIYDLTKIGVVFEADADILTITVTHAIH